MRTHRIDSVQVCFEDARRTPPAIPRRAKFEAPGALGDALMRLAGYPGAYSDLFSYLQWAGVLPEGPHNVLGAGAAAATLLRAYRELAGTQAACTAHDLSRPLNFPSEHFDLVMSAHCIERTPDPGGAVRGMARVLEHHGLLILITGRARARIDACEVMGWMWDSNIAPLGRLRFGAPYHAAHWLSEAVLGRKEADSTL